MFFNQNYGFGIKGFLTKFYTVYIRLSNASRSKRPYNVYSISHGFCSQCFIIKNINFPQASRSY